MRLFGLAERAIKVIELQRFHRVLATQKRMLQLSPQGGADQRRVRNPAPREIAKGPRKQPVPLHPALVPQEMLVALIASEQLVTAFPGEHYFHMLRSQLRNEI